MGIDGWRSAPNTMICFACIQTIWLLCAIQTTHTHFSGHFRNLTIGFGCREELCHLPLLWVAPLCLPPNSTSVYERRPFGIMQNVCGLNLKRNVQSLETQVWYFSRIDAKNGHTGWVLCVVCVDYMANMESGWEPFSIMQWVFMFIFENFSNHNYRESN